MIISRTPLRISFVGGGSDLKSFYKNEPGAVVSTTINKYIYITVNKKFDQKIRASYSQTEIKDKVSQVKHELIREGLKMVNIKGGIEITSIADIPSEGTGLGSSSSYIVGLLNALYAHLGKHSSAEDLARKACEIEIEKIKKPIGKQDQYIASYGGFNYIQFNPNGSVFVNPIVMSASKRKKLEENMLLLYTGLTRSSSDILSKQKKNMENQKEKIDIMGKMVNLAKEMRDVLNKGDINSFGELLHENWLLKRELSDGISNSKIDYWYKLARRKGAVGGKICGAGGGGFLLFYAHRKDHKKISSALGLKPLNFSFEDEGTKIIFILN